MNKIAGLKSLVDVMNYFNTTEKCKGYLEKSRWNGQICCPVCGSTKVYISKATRFNYICADKDCTQNIFSVTKGTMFENSPISLQKWFMAIWLLTSHKKGISSLQLSRDIGVTQKTAWFILHRVRHSIRTESFSNLLTDTVEADETYIVGKNRNKHIDKRIPNSQGRSLKGKTPVFGLLQRGGHVRVQKVTDTKGETLRPIIYKHVKEDSNIMTDEWWAYRGLKGRYNHQVVKHKSGQYVLGSCHTNTLEGFWGLLKRGIIGIYHYMSPKHLNKYLGEFEYRYNTRDLNEVERFNNMLSLCNTRLRYDDLIRVSSV